MADLAAPLAAWPYSNGDMARRIRTHDWAATPLGPIETWPAELRAAVGLVLEAAFPAALVWGPDLTTLYNDAFVSLLRSRPDALGRSFKEIWRESWEEVGPLVRRAYAGEAAYVENCPLILDRSGVLERVTLTLSYSPVRSADGTVAGMLAIVTETTRAVEASEEKYRSLFEAIDEGVALCELVRSKDGRVMDYRFLEVNRAFGRLTGLPMAHATGRLRSEVVPVPDARSIEIAARVAESGEPTCLEYHDAALDRWFEVRLSPQGADRFAAVFSDVTKRKRAEAALRASAERQAFLLKLSDALRAEPDGLEMAEVALRLLAEHMRLDRAYIAAVHAAEDCAEVTSQYRRADLPEIPWTLRLSDFPEGFRQVKEGRLVANDIATDPSLSDLDRQSLAAINLTAFIVASVREGERNLVWALVAGSAERRSWTPAEIELVQEAAERIWAALERVHAEEALRRSEEKFRTLFDSIDEGCLLAEVVFDEGEKPVDIFYTEANSAAIRLAGRDFTGRHMREIDPSYEEYWFEIYGRIALTGEPMRAERYAEPHRRWFEFYAFKVGGQGSRRVATIFQDTTDRHRAEAALRESEERQAFLLKLSDALRPLADPAEIQNVAMRMLGERLALSRAFYLKAERDESGWVHIVERDYHRAPGMASVVGRHRLEAFGSSVFDGMEDGKLAVVPDVSTLPGLTAEELGSYAAFDLRAFVNVPLVKNGEYVAAVCVHDSAPRHWTEAEIELIREVTERTWADVERARAEAALRESEARFRALVTAGTYMTYRMSPDWRHMYQLSGRGMLVDTAVPVENWADTYLLPEDKPVIFGVIEEAIRTKSLFELEHRVRRADGGSGWVVSRAVPILGPDGEIVEWFGAGSDVTDRREAQEKLRRAEDQHRSELERQVRERTRELQDSRDLLRATMDSSMDMIQVFEAVRDERGEIVDFRWILNNHTSERIYGDVIGRSLLQNNPGVVEEGIFDTFKHVVETGEPHQAERQYVHEQFDGWFYQSTVKLGDGVATTTSNITERKKAEQEILRLQQAITQAKLDESEKRFRAFINTIPALIWHVDNEGMNVFSNRYFEDFVGKPADELQGTGWGAILHPDDRDAYVAAFMEAVRERRPWRGRGRARRHDGAWRWMESFSQPLFSLDGAHYGHVGVSPDVTIQVEAEAALRESEGRLRALVEGIPQLVWRASGSGEWSWASPQWVAYTGLSDEASRGLGWLDAVHPDDRDAVLAAWREAGATGALRVEHRLHYVGEGRYRWVQTQALPVRDVPDAAQLEGRILEWLGTSTDVEDLRRQQVQRILIDELHHRTRNLLAVVASVAEQTLATCGSLGEFGPLFDQRLGALGRVQNLLSREVAPNVTLEELVRMELEAHGVGGGASGRVRLHGPGVVLPADAVQMLALALHELTTNALKHGALRGIETGDTGRLDIGWEVREGGAGGPRLRLDWVESGVWTPGVGGGDGAPPHRGFGLDLLEVMLPYELLGETRLEFGPDGVRCAIELPFHGR